MRRLLIACALLLWAGTAQAQTLGGPGVWYDTGNPSVYIVKATPNVATSGIIHEALYTITLKANALAVSGDALIITAHFTTAANTNTKYGRVTSATVGGTIIAATTTSSSAAGISLQVMICRTGATTARALMPVYFTTATSTQLGTTTNLTGLDFAADMVFVVTGLTQTAAADITLIAVTAFVSN